jgi:AraC-like DNA-binding protein
MGTASYREWAPRDDLGGHLACVWAGRTGDDGTPHTDRVLPDGCLDVIWDGADLFVAGPDTGPVPMQPAAGTSFVGVRFRPGLAPTLLGMPSFELRDRRVPLGDIWGPEPAARLAEELHGAGSVPAVAARLEAGLAARLPAASPPDALVGAAVALLARGAGPMSELASRLGVSERSLLRRCTAAVGYGPKTLERVLRFRRFLMLGQDSSDGLARLGAEAGYADQPHLTRECVALSGLTPGVLLARRHVRVVQDGLGPAGVTRRRPRAG